MKRARQKGNAAEGVPFLLNHFLLESAAIPQEQQAVVLSPSKDERTSRITQFSHLIFTPTLTILTNTVLSNVLTSKYKYMYLPSVTP